MVYIMEYNTYGVGYNSKGEYPTVINGKFTKCYATWNDMMRRCYDLKLQERYPTYIGCEVCEEWYDFQNFAKWYENNYHEVGDERMNLDKDILIKGNKTYSPQTCVFVPHKINMLFTKSNKKRGNSPIGVNENGNGYQVYCRNGDKQIYLGRFDNPHEAFLMYKLNKELLIQGIANEYKDKIPTRLYEALMKYEVNEWD